MINSEPSARTPLIAGNWKMFTTADECVALCRALRELIDDIDGVDKAVCPPFPFLERAKAALDGSSIRLGAQNVHWEERGAYTGEVSPLMLEGLVEYAIVGHSERRQYFGETDETVNGRLMGALDCRLTPIFCVGETQEEREAGRTEEVLRRQVLRGLDGVPWTSDCVIAYEPIWAIGTGRTPTNEQIAEVHAHLRARLGAAGEGVRLLYGGSVKPGNAGEIFTVSNVDGGLVGGASLKAADFAAIVAAAG
jgi:triosephosphate isomerase (TIM)